MSSVSRPWQSRKHLKYRAADKSLARTGRKQANVCIRMAWISFGTLTCRKKNWWHLASRCCWNHARPCHASEVVYFLIGLRTYQHTGKIRLTTCNIISILNLTKFFKLICPPFHDNHATCVAWLSCAKHRIFMTSPAKRTGRMGKPQNRYVRPILL